MFEEAGMSLDTSQVSIMTKEDIYLALNTSARGLSFHEAEQRLKTCGPNAIAEEEGESIFQKFLEQFKEPLIILLLTSAVVSVIMGEIADAIGIFIAVTIVNAVGFYQEYKSEKSVEALKSLTAHHCAVIRDDGIHTILAADLVPGDIVPIESGFRTPADIRMLESTNLYIGKHYHGFSLHFQCIVI